MNKNWFYRVLALALVAMLAVPMFAFAEEDVLAPAAEAPAAELATTLEGEELEPIAKRSLAGITVFDIYLGYSVVEDLGDFDINLPFQREFQLNLVNSDGSKESFKSSNKKVASVSPTGFVSLYGAGKVTITCTGKVNGKKKTTKFSLTAKDPTNPDSMNGHFYEAAFARAEEGTDVWGFDDLPYSDLGGEELLGKSDDGYYPGMGFVQDDIPAMVYEPVPFNDGDWVGPIYQNGYHYKHSNAKAMFFDGNNHKALWDLLNPDDDDAYEGPVSPVDKPFKASSKFWYNILYAAPEGEFDDDDAILAWLLELLGLGDLTELEQEQIWNAYTYDQGLAGYNFPNHILVPVFYKPGKNTLTIKTQATAGLKSYTYTCKFDIAKQKITLRRGTDKELQKRAEYNDEILYQVDTLDIQSMDKVVLTMKIYNGTGFGFTPKDIQFAASVTDTAISNLTVTNAVVDDAALRTPFLQYGLDYLGDEWTADSKTVRNNKVKGSVKPHKTTTLTITFENTRNGDFNIKSLGGHVFDAANSTRAAYAYFEALTNISQGSKDALEVISPYPDVWDGNFQFHIDWFTFGADWGERFDLEYAFGVNP